MQRVPETFTALFLQQLRRRKAADSNDFSTSNAARAQIVNFSVLPCTLYVSAVDVKFFCVFFFTLLTFLFFLVL